MRNLLRTKGLRNPIGSTLCTMDSVGIPQISASFLKNWSNRVRRKSWESRKKQLSLGEDGFCDSIGHCAAFDTYTFMDMRRMKVIDLNNGKYNI